MGKVIEIKIHGNCPQYGDGAFMLMECDQEHLFLLSEIQKSSVKIKKIQLFNVLKKLMDCEQRRQWVAEEQQRIKEEQEEWNRIAEKNRHTLKETT